MRRDRSADLAAVGALSLLQVVWGGLLWARPDRFCFSDCPIEMLPRLVAVARAFQAGSLPLWDVNTFSGAKPFWMSMGGLYYPLLFPLYLLTDTTDLRQAARLLQVLPYVLHLLWASLGGYFFARRAVRLSVWGGVVLGLAFTFSPSMQTLYFVTQVQGYSYLPWITLAAVRVVDTGSRRTWAAGALLVGAMCFATNPDMVNRTLFLVGIQVGAYWLVSQRRRWTRQQLGRLGSLVPMALLGMGTYTFGFVGLFKGITMALAGLSLSCQQVATFTDYSSVRPASLLTVFYPASFVSIWEMANLGAGVLLLVAASYACIMAPRLPSAARAWTCIAVAVAGFSALVALGYHTPVFGWACGALPLVFGFPHPAGYLVAVSWGLALLAGVGVSALATGSPSRPALAACAWPLVASALITWTRPDIPSFEWGSGPMSASGYVMTAAVLLVIAAAVPRRWRGGVVCAGVLAEVLLSPFALAVNLPSGQPLPWMDHTKWTLSHNSASELWPILRRIAGEDKVRFVGTRSFVDNQAWVVDGRALLGLNAKPVFPRFERAMSAFTVNAPYQAWLVKLPRFLSNMNVGYLIADREPTYHVYVDRDHADFDAAVARLPLLAQTPRFDIRALPPPLPYAYTQDRVFVAGPDEQFTRIMETDLREAAYISPEAGVEHQAILASSARMDTPPPGHFEELQKANAVMDVERQSPNRKVIRVAVQRPALLIIAEAWYPGWRARVDGKRAAVWEVNSMQQGVWVTPGTHVIELYFRPDALGYGALASAASLCAIAVVAVRGAVRRRPRTESS
jgi:hypothetical protein